MAEKTCRKPRTKMIDGKPHVYVQFTESCSGCTNYIDGQLDGDYPYDAKAHCHVGAGCPECGYTGKRRNRMWIPEDGGFDG